MKTAMKKIFSLILVAVLLVGVLPFQASAWTVDMVITAPGLSTITKSGGVGDAPQSAADWVNWEFTNPAGSWKSSGIADWTSAYTISAVYVDGVALANVNEAFTFPADSSHTLRIELASTSSGGGEGGTTPPPSCSHNWADATCSAPETCTLCGATKGTTLAHTPGTAATCTAAQTCTVCGTQLAPVLGHLMMNANCNSPSTCSRCGYTTGTAVGHTWAGATCTTARTCTLCGIKDEVGGPALGHDWRAATCVAPKTCNRCAVTEGSALGHDWRDDTSPKTCRDCGARLDSVTQYSVHYNLNVNGSGSVLLGYYDANTSLSTALASLSNIKHPGYYSDWYYLEGWYLDANYTTRATGNITRNCTVYAKWARNYEHNVYLKIYKNGNFSSVVRIEDMFDYAQDRVITLSEVTAVVTPLIKANNNAGLKIYGPFMPENWEIYSRDGHKLNINEQITVYNDRDTTIYVMVHNAEINGKTNASGSKADSSNPKTGDMIFMPAAVLGLSATALAVMFFYKKKRTV